jgi:YidC/Oxa1 family membrane protein insertase
MEKRLPLALLLCVLLYVLWMGLFPPPKPVEPAPGAAAADTNATTLAATPPASGAAQPPLPAGAALGEPRESSRLLPPIEGNGYRAQFETWGASLSWLELTGYHPAGTSTPLRLVGAVDGHSPNLQLRDFADAWGLDRSNWEVADQTNELGRRRLVFTKRLDNGLLFTRTIDDRGELNKFVLSIEVTNEGGKDVPGTLTLVLEPAHGLFDENDGKTFLMLAPTALAGVRNRDGDTKITKWAGKDLAEGTSRKIGDGDELLVAGSMTNYFAMLVAPGPGTSASLVEPAAVLDASRLEQAVEASNLTDELARQVERRKLESSFHTNAAAELLLASAPPAPGQTRRWDWTVFAGPKDDALVAAGGNDFLHPVLEDRYGLLPWINHSLLFVLRVFHAATGNWGWAIILLTILVRALLFPLNRVNQTGMLRYSAAMQRLKPQLEALKAKYKNNMRKFNEEQMKLLKDEGVRPPLGGCLLMFLQLPVWVSLYQILRTSIELRQAPFMLWVHDLSKPDHLVSAVPLIGTLNLLPILMCVAQVLQMRLQPPPADAQQAQMQRIMGMLMPVMMLFVLYNYASGLALYIFTSSMLGILEYRVIRKFWPPPGVTPVPARLGKPAKAGA